MNALFGSPNILLQEMKVCLICDSREGPLTLLTQRGFKSLKEFAKLHRDAHVQSCIRLSFFKGPQNQSTGRPTKSENMTAFDHACSWLENEINPTQLS